MGWEPTGVQSTGREGLDRDAVDLSAAGAAAPCSGGRLHPCGLCRLPFGSCSVPAPGFPVFAFPKSAAAKHHKLGLRTPEMFLSQFWRLEVSHQDRF